MITKLQIKTIAGEIAFEHECDGNTIKQTVIALLSAFKGKWINNVDLSNTDLSGIDFSNSTFYNSKFYNSKFYNSTFYNSTFDNSTFDNSTFYNSKFDNSKFYNSTFDNSKFYNSKFYNSTFDNSTFDNSTFYNSKFDNSKFYNSKFDNSKFYNSTFDNSKFYNSTFYNSTFDNSTFDKSSAEGALNSGAFDSIKADFMYRMLKQKNEVPFLREKIIAGEIDGTCYEGECCCFVGTIAKAANCNYEKLPNLKPDSSSPTELWFYAFRKGYTPDNNEIAKITLGWIDEFLFLIQATPAPAE